MQIIKNPPKDKYSSKNQWVFTLSFVDGENKWSLKDYSKPDLDNINVYFFCKTEIGEVYTFTVTEVRDYYLCEKPDIIVNAKNIIQAIEEVQKQYLTDYIS